MRNNIDYDYLDWFNFQGVDYKSRKYRYEPGLLFVPLEIDIDLLIAGFNVKYSVYLQLLKGRFTPILLGKHFNGEDF